MESFHAIKHCKNLAEANETDSLLLKDYYENSDGSFTYQFKVYANKEIARVMVDDPTTNSYINTDLKPFEATEAPYYIIESCLLEDKKIQLWTITVAPELMARKCNGTLKFSSGKPRKLKPNFGRKICTWRVSSAGPIIIGLFAVSLISRSTDSKLHTLYTQAHEALKNQTSHSFFLLMSYFIQFFFDYDALTPSTYPSYAVAFFIGFITCYFMIFLADKENNNGAHTFSLFPFKKDRRNVNGL